ncbi:MAG: hypothetical protein U1C71_04230 [archaeon]|nr:hypothetical protein [archaeon]
MAIFAKKKPAFGGYSISFAGRNDSIEDIMGNKPIPPSEMTKKLWAFVKKNNLSNK